MVFEIFICLPNNVERRSKTIDRQNILSRGVTSEAHKMRIQKPRKKSSDILTLILMGKRKLNWGVSRRVRKK